MEYGYLGIQMRKMKAKKLLVVIPHSGIKRPLEIRKKWLSKYQNRFLYGEDCETDRCTERLYDFRKILKNQQIVFPYSLAYINICREDKYLDEVFPAHIYTLPVYTTEKILNSSLKKKLLKKYYLPFYKKIEMGEKKLILNGHSTIAGHPSLGDDKLYADIALSSFFFNKGRRIVFCPDKYIDFYGNEIKKRLPFLKVEKNSIYISFYDMICKKFGWDGKSKRNGRVPVIHQETNERLYMNGGKVNMKKLDTLRKCFAESLFATMEHFNLNS